MLWSEGHSEILSVGNVMGKRKLWGSLSGLSTMRTTLIHHRHLSKMKKRLMEGRAHLSLNFLGVLPTDRKRQVGTSLLKYLLNKADEAQMPIFSEVWGEKHLKWLQKYGFTIEAEKNMNEKGNIMIYYLVREPQIDPKTPTVFSPAEAIEALHLEPPREDALAALEDS
ncbi:hypothetical protein K501DRAFT_212595 [Backusella circina FSU 941]|nr:hypothetical protein K501DRAFT_212595 [Backusella circina FSU 941]